jgi:hypothetical protein
MIAACEQSRGRFERGRYLLCDAKLTGDGAALDGTAAGICRISTSREFIAILSNTAASLSTWPYCAQAVSRLDAVFHA